MQRIILSLDQVSDIALKNRYKVNPKRKFLSRCIDGRYINEEDLPALAFPGADIGQLVLVLAAANSFGFEVDREKVVESLLELIGGEENFQLHTDSDADPEVVAGGCGHWKQISLDPKAYDLNLEQLEFIKKINFAKSAILEGDHLEGAILLIKGNWGIYPRYLLNSGQGKRLVEVFIYHQSLVDERHQALAKILIKNKAVNLVDGCGEEWLYSALSDTAESHLFETVKRLSPGLPIYRLIFSEDGSFQINLD